ncbi:MAG: hypothetical protein LLG45_04515 [Actinomycetia bacterium]|nr:hypothetical protein [Actinomycetes bacterium]
MSESRDIVTLSIGRGASALPVIRVLIGGMASRNDLPLDRLDDVILAVESLLAEESEVGSELVLEVCRSDAGFRVCLGGLENQRVKAALLGTGPFRPREGCPLDVRLLVGSLVESFKVIETGPASFAVEMEKQAS